MYSDPSSKGRTRALKRGESWSSSHSILAKVFSNCRRRDVLGEGIFSFERSRQSFYSDSAIPINKVACRIVGVASYASKYVVVGG